MADDTSQDPVPVMASLPQRRRGPDETDVPQPSIPNRNNNSGSRAARTEPGNDESTTTSDNPETAHTSNNNHDAGPPFHRLVTPSRVEHEIRRRIEQEPERLAPHWEYPAGEQTTSASTINTEERPRTPSPTKKVHAAALSDSEHCSPSNRSGGSFFAKFSKHGRNRSDPLLDTNNFPSSQSRRRPRVPGRQQTKETTFRVRFGPEDDPVIRRHIHKFDNEEFVSTDSNVRKQVWYSALELRAIRQANLDHVRRTQDTIQQQPPPQHRRRIPSVPRRTMSSGGRIFKKFSRKMEEQSGEASDDHNHDAKSATSSDNSFHDNGSNHGDIYDDETCDLRGLEHYLEGETKRRQRIHDFVTVILQVQTEYRRKGMHDDLVDQLHQFCRSQSRGDRRRAQKLGEQDAAQIPELVQSGASSSSTTRREKLMKRMSINPVSSWFSSSIRSAGTTSSWSAQSTTSSKHSDFG